ncbi:trehalose-phosphatase [Novosphingobium sp. 9U]|uniref:trehalose-phosphatase n=1 Tax=Novosphingobium sp. 9U TaxID=2653158 RepID=UPI0012F38EF8|nr:trehalose-phosphatase [Novosphingobium sp. 9U]VWX52924.1 Trehalose 6-phosphate phosphatase [Novosphingobium sp. 9U]
MTIAIFPELPASREHAPLPAPPQLGAGAGLALFLDFDGTLVEIADHPQGVVVAPELPEALAALSQRLEGRLAIVSGRALATLDRLLDHAPVAMAGSHGGEFRPVGASQVEPLADPLPKPVCQALDTFAQENGGLVFEAKPFSAAVHYRDRPEIGEALHDFAAALAADNGLKIKHGKMVVELSMPGSDKGNAVNRFMELPPFAGTRPLFVGDDVTDEDAFGAVRRFDGGGILVGPMRQTAALWRLDNVAAVHRWLEEQA